VLQGHRIPVIRGSLDDVRARYLQAAADMADDDLMVRLTADNVFPDGAFVGELVAFAKRAGCEYCAPFFPASGLPYGMSAEIFTVGALRRAAAEHDHPEDREHVTPALKKLADSSGGFRPEGWTRDAAHLRCTLDTFDDYERLLRVFRGVSDPVAIGWRQLVDRLASLDDAPRFRIPSRVRKGRLHGVMALGTAQLGLERGEPAGKPGLPGRRGDPESVERVGEGPLAGFDPILGEPAEPGGHTDGGERREADPPAAPPVPGGEMLFELGDPRVQGHGLSRSAPARRDVRRDR
ncbi:MAG: hypothetical protein WHT63_10560, partial [Tepidiforma sp.]